MGNGDGWQTVGRQTLTYHHHIDLISSSDKVTRDTKVNDANYGETGVTDIHPANIAAQEHEAAPCRIILGLDRVQIKSGLITCGNSSLR